MSRPAERAFCAVEAMLPFGLCLLHGVHPAHTERYGTPFRVAPQIPCIEFRSFIMRITGVHRSGLLALLRVARVGTGTRGGRCMESRQ